MKLLAIYINKNNIVVHRYFLTLQSKEKLSDVQNGFESMKEKLLNLKMIVYDLDLCFRPILLISTDAASE